MAKIRKFAAFILTGVIITGLFNAAFAQSDYEDGQTFTGGLILGANFTQVDGDNYAGYHKTGLNTGGIVFANLAENFAVSMEILYSQKGSRAHQTQRSNTGLFTILKYNIDLNYAEVPIMLNYVDKKRFFAGAGVSYSQLVGSKESVITIPDFPSTIDLTKYPFKKYDVDFLLGFGFKIVKGLYLNARFQYSVLPVRKDIYKEFGRAEQYNNVWAIRLMYLFQKKDNY